MSLLLKLSATVNNAGATEILIKDTTGAYNSSTNTGGYGLANSFLLPTLGMLRYKTWEQTSWVNKALSPTEVLALQGSGGLAANLAMVGSALTGAFPDGVNQLQHIPLNDSAITATFTSGSKIVTLAGGFNPNTPGSTLCAFIVGISNSTDPAGGDHLTDALEVDWSSTATNNTSQITLKSAYSGDTFTVELYYGPYKDIKFLVNKAGERCISETLASSSSLGCGCDSTYPQVNRMIQWKFTADVAFDCGDYTGAHNTIVQLNRICNQNSITCACF